MRFLVPVGAAAFLALPAITLLYFLKVHRPEVPISSLLFWGRNVGERRADTPWQRLRATPLLVLQLLLAAVLALTLMRPGFSTAVGVPTTTVVLIDGSPTMRATDVTPTRFDAAVAVARQLSRELGPNQSMAVAVMGDSAELLAPPTRDTDVLDKAFDRARPGSRPADLAEGISLANSLLTGRPGGSTVLISDGHAEAPATTPRLAGSLRYYSIGSSGENVAVESVGRQADGNVFIRVANTGQAARSVEVELLADGELVDVVGVDVDPDGTAETSWAGLPAGTRLLQARLQPGDDFALDDSGWLVTAERAQRRALLVTPGNGFLQRALELQDDLDLTVVEPAAYTPGGDYDLYVFDQAAAPNPLPGPSLLVAPLPGSGPLPGEAKELDPGALLPTDPRELLLRYVSLQDVNVQVAGEIVPLPGWRTVIAGSGAPLLLVNDSQPRAAQLTFDIHRSDLPLRPAFPILVRNLTSFLLPGGLQDEVLPLGEPVPLAVGADATSVEVTGPGGYRRRLVAPFPATLAGIPDPGVYTVTTQGRQGQTSELFLTQLPVPSGARIAPGPAPLVEAEASRPTGAASQETTREIWRWLAWAILLLVGLEWLVFLRR